VSVSDEADALVKTREIDIGENQADSVSVAPQSGQVACGTDTGVKLYALGEQCAALHRFRRAFNTPAACARAEFSLGGLRAPARALATSETVEEQTNTH
jgi:hypothetical protein